jgi:hypothetical protein
MNLIDSVLAKADLPSLSKQINEKKMAQMDNQILIKRGKRNSMIIKLNYNSCSTKQLINCTIEKCK